MINQGYFRAAAAAAILANASLAFASTVDGTSAGVFVNPILQPSANVSGVGTNSFSWGTPITGSSANNLTFIGTGFSTPVGSYFDVGTITYFNGAVGGGTGADGVTLSVTLSFTNPAGVVQTFDYALAITSTPNLGGDPAVDADRIDFTTAAPQSFVLDGNTVTLGLEVGTTGPLGFTSQTSFSVFENQRETAVLRGILRSPNGVPEPGSLALLGAAGLAAWLSRRRKLA